MDYSITMHHQPEYEIFMRPQVRFLTDKLIEQIISEARASLIKVGVTIHNDNILSLLNDHGAMISKEKNHVLFTQEIIDLALKSVPSAFNLLVTM